MADDLANNWGITLCLPDTYRRSLRSPALPRVLGNDGGRGSSATLPGLVSAETDQFTFERVSICGSQANSWAVDDATNHNASRCLFAAGSYVAGDASALQCFSTSEFSTGSELALITPPEEVQSPAGRANTVPLPYHIPGLLKPDELMAYEDECLQAVHIRLCWAKMRSEPYKALLLELMLAGNGAILSNRALVSIGKLAAHHQLCVIVDEIMTGGRTGSMFFLLSKPLSFQAEVTHITFGKWIQMGMVFLSKTWAEKRKKLYPVTKRGASTYLEMEEAVLQWRCVKKCLSEIPTKRENLLKRLKLKEKQVWGAGLIVFGPIRRDTPRGLKCRYLPLIHANTPIDSAVKSSKMRHFENFRTHVNHLIMDATRKWILDAPQPKVDPEYSTLAEQRMDGERLSDFAFIAKLIKECSELDEKPSEEWMKECMQKDINRTHGEAALGRLKLAGCMETKQRGKKRKRNWKLREGFIAPWKSEDFDEIIAGIEE